MFAGHTHRGFRTSTNECSTYRHFSEGFGSTFARSWAVCGFLTRHLVATARSTDAPSPPLTGSVRSSLMRQNKVFLVG